MMEAAAQALDRARRDQEWQWLDDPVARARVLWALRYDQRPEDEDLVRHLVGLAAKHCADDPDVGMGEEAELAGFLLAQYGRVEDVWVHYGLKMTNMDTGTSYDIGYVLAAGVAETVAHVRASEHERRDELLERLDGVDQSEVDEFLAERGEWFPADPADEDPYVWVDRAMLIGDTAAAPPIPRRVGRRAGPGRVDARRAGAHLGPAGRARRGGQGDGRGNRADHRLVPQGHGSDPAGRDAPEGGRTRGCLARLGFRGGDPG
ncbi:hypothetical protein [Herbihabitans rhizosphaerae]|uniref:hypothetical protein n=1 Tax=Herbihabitans rhizosphaerae TaxID=1872711 RepID=UPI00102ABE7D|nr:hypothetical protein [Herbihabitans rhizosphaerae]